MTKRHDPVSVLITALLLVWMVAVGRAVAAGGPPQAVGSAPAKAEPAKATPAKATPAKAAAPSAAQANEYIGEDTCLTCHEDRNYKGTRHALASLWRRAVHRWCR